MTTPAQIAANRRNAALSTGPTGPGGKQRASYNSLRHGLYARDVVLPGEDRAAYDGLLASLIADLKPLGPIEDGLVERMARLWWRLGRSSAIEAGLLNPDWQGDTQGTGGGPLIDTFRVAIDETPTLDQLGRYEGRLERAFTRTLDLLERLQSLRRAGRINDR
ncbi:MAG: hypothetical protein ACTSV1_00400 [Alphaproteobacteria bacterium]